MIVATMLGAVYPAIMQSQHTVRRGRDHYVAAALCLAIIEQARKQDYVLLPKMVESQRQINDQGNYDRDGGFRRTVAVRPNTPSAGLTEVAVTIEIRDRRNGVFMGETERMSSLYTTYLKVR
jgi:hypothetical protein